MDRARVVFAVELDCRTGLLSLPGLGGLDLEALGLGDPAPDLVEALVRSKRPQAARTALEAFEARIAARQSAVGLAVAARCRALLADDRFYDEWFRRALARHDRADSPFERARTELCFGERLRRSRRRGEARAHLHSALATFEALGQETWAARARAEIAATGERTGPPEGGERLTPQERQVARLAAEGASNKEIAARLFLSIKTIEFHLGNVYRKLDVHSRARLAALFAHQPLGEAA